MEDFALAGIIGSVKNIQLDFNITLYFQTLLFNQKIISGTSLKCDSQSPVFQDIYRN